MAGEKLLTSRGPLYRLTAGEALGANAPPEGVAAPVFGPDFRVIFISAEIFMFLSIFGAASTTANSSVQSCHPIFTSGPLCGFRTLFFQPVAPAISRNQSDTLLFNSSPPAITIKAGPPNPHCSFRRPDVSTDARRKKQMALFYSTPQLLNLSENQRRVFP